MTDDTGLYLLEIQTTRLKYRFSVVWSSTEKILFMAYVQWSPYITIYKKILVTTFHQHRGTQFDLLFALCYFVSSCPNPVVFLWCCSNNMPWRAFDHSIGITTRHFN